MKKFLLALSLVLGASAFAGDTKECKKDCKDFVKECEKSCDSQLKKSDPKGKAGQACKKNCGDFVKQCEKGCENGEF